MRSETPHFDFILTTYLYNSPPRTAGFLYTSYIVIDVVDLYARALVSISAPMVSAIYPLFPEDGWNH
jgi:hypothetical protein